MKLLCSFTPSPTTYEIFHIKPSLYMSIILKCEHNRNISKETSCEHDIITTTMLNLCLGSSIHVFIKISKPDWVNGLRRSFCSREDFVQDKSLRIRTKNIIQFQTSRDVEIMVNLIQVFNFWQMVPNFSTIILHFWCRFHSSAKHCTMNYIRNFLHVSEGVGNSISWCIQIRPWSDAHVLCLATVRLP